MALPTNVKISVQSLAENKIQEIAYDGKETFLKPLTISENLTDLANRIDFLNVDDDDDDTLQADVADEDSLAFQMKQWPWEGIRNHLQRALIEMNVLVDVMSISQNKTTTSKENTPENVESNRYLMYDAAPKEAEQGKPVIQVLTKKKCLYAASKILLNGSDRLSKAWTEESTSSNFHSELLKLRQLWRVRRVGDKIIGDLSYKTAGSDFWHSGSFDVIKNSSNNDDDVGADKSLSSPSSLLKSSISVSVSPSLLGHASIFVSIINTQSDGNAAKRALNHSCSISYFDLIEKSHSNASEPSWHRKLCNAQNVLFCRELFMLLTKEAIQCKSSGLVTPFVVVGDTISTNVFSDTKLVVKLVYSRKASNQSNQVEVDVNYYSLKHALLQLLQTYHSQKLNVSPPHPTAAVFGLKHRMRQAATQACPDRQLQARYQRERLPLAECLIKMARHYEIRKRLSQVIDSLTKQFHDPDILAHWSIINDMYESSVRVTISSSGFETCHRSIVQLTVMTNEVRALQKEGKILSLSIDTEDIYNYFISLISSHQLFAVQSLARIIGWTLLSMSPHSSQGRSSALKNRGTLTVSSPAGDKGIAIICNVSMDSSFDYEVYIQYTKGSVKPDIQMKDTRFSLESSKYSVLCGDWHQVDWPSLHGKHFINKMETLLTVVSY